MGLTATMVKPADQERCGRSDAALGLIGSSRSSPGRRTGDDHCNAINTTSTLMIITMMIDDHHNTIKTNDTWCHATTLPVFGGFTNSWSCQRRTLTSSKEIILFQDSNDYFHNNDDYYDDCNQPYLLALDEKATRGFDNVWEKGEVVQSGFQPPVAQGVHQHLFTNW